MPERFLMHEMSIAQSLVDILREEMEKNGARTLRSVRLSIGRLSAVVPDSLEFCFTVMTAETELEGATLIMDMVPLRGACHDCNKTFEIEDYAFLCPSCGGTNIETIAGQDLSIVEMEVD
ncbi:MAG: hydrogenase maturation nickel metallochaperone HypA [Pseudomonadota bacterium]